MEHDTDDQGSAKRRRIAESPPNPPATSLTPPAANTSLLPAPKSYTEQLVANAQAVKSGRKDDPCRHECWLVDRDGVNEERRQCRRLLLAVTAPAIQIGSVHNKGAELSGTAFVTPKSKYWLDRKTHSTVLAACPAPLSKETDKLFDNYLDKNERRTAERRALRERQVATNQGRLTLSHEWFTTKMLLDSLGEAIEASYNKAEWSLCNCGFAFDHSVEAAVATPALAPLVTSWYGSIAEQAKLAINPSNLRCRVPKNPDLFLKEIEGIQSQVPYLADKKGDSTFARLNLPDPKDPHGSSFMDALLSKAVAHLDLPVKFEREMSSSVKGFTRREENPAFISVALWERALAKESALEY
ncbi:uncharacterized protein JCM15063_005697 [Sporobolomyces koalae]|uniref:uncharacterized protein n=1 Tax=Sporobolomyces koalae TaxID=500713 RepID=UPI00316D312B